MDTTLPQLERVARLGAGATSTVDLARLKRPWRGLAAGAEVAVKRLHPELAADPVARAALHAEAESGARVRHPSLVRVLGLCQDGEDPVLVLAYVPGPSLAERLASEGPLQEPLVRKLGEELAGALAALHTAGLVHGDLKPENIRQDAKGRAVLLDLGLARAVQGATAPAGGSLLYLSPERARGEPAGPPSDVFALGLVLYELATGAHPCDPRAGGLQSGGLGRTSGRLLPRAIEEEGADAFLARLATARVQAASTLAPELSPFLDAVLLAALARSPEERPAAGELAIALSDGESGRWWRERAAASAPAPLPADLELPLVGRDEEVALLEALLREVQRTEKGAVAWLVGPEGSGKWRLAREFAARARRGLRPPIYLYARWSEVVESRHAGALLFLLHRWLQLPPGRVPGKRARERIAALVPPDVAQVLEAALHPAADERLAGSVGAALATWLAALSRSRPVIVFLDDLQRAGAVTLGALMDLVRGIDRMRVLLLLGIREEVSPQNPAALSGLRALVARMGGRATARIEFRPLRESDVQELVRRAFHRSVPRIRLGEVLWQRSRGNPGLISEIVHALAARGELALSPEGGLLMSVSPDELPMPNSLQTLIAERLAHVPGELRRWLERLAVIGGRIEPSFVLAAFPPTTRQEVDDLLARLVRLGWLVPAGPRYRFARPALREAVYRAMSAPRRVRLHAAAARGLAAQESRKASPEVLFQRAFHLRAADEHAECLGIVLELLHGIRGRASAQRLMVLARWGLEAYDRLPARAGEDGERLFLLEVAADAADRLGARQEERELLDRLVDLDLDPDVDPASAARLYLLHGRYAAGTGQFGLARGFLRNAVQLAERTEQRGLRSEANRRLATVQAQIGELVEARRLSEQALSEAVEPNHQALALLALATIDALEDHFEDGLERVGAALHVLRDLPVPSLGVLGFASLLRARLLRSAGRFARALGAARHAVRLAERAGEKRFEAEARARLGALLLDLDRTEEAEAQLRDALLRSREIEDRRGQVIAETWLGILLWEAYDPTARGVVERAAQAAQEIGFYRAEAVALAILARIRRAAGDVEEAARASSRAAELVHLYGAELSDRIVILGSHALVLHTAERAAEARAVVRDLRRHMRQENGRIRAADLRRGQRAYSTQLLELVLSPDGPVYPRYPRNPRAS